MQKKRSLRILSAVLAIALLIGCSFAYFTDYATTQANGTAGTVALSMDSNINLLDADGQDIINPGDQRDAGFTVTNEGNKSIDVRTTVVLTTQSNAGFDLTFSGDNATQSEYDLYYRDDVEFVDGYGYQPKDGAEPLQVKSVDADTITYILPEYSLNGNSAKYDEVESIDGVDAYAHTYDLVMVMKGAAGNEWQNSAVSIDVLVEAKQHENTQSGWEIVAQENVTSGAINQDAVKGENVITKNTNVVTYIPVTSIDENGENLNATSTLIEGEEAEQLLNSLDAAGLANKEDVDLLIDVKSDNFDGMADTTFDVSDIANEGDTVVILHYDETKGEWEHIATETVADGKVGGDFSSYSPVAFVVIPNLGGGDEPATPDVTDGNTIKITVVDTEGNPLPFVSPVVVSDDFSMFPQFADTDANGYTESVGTAETLPAGTYHIMNVLYKTSTGAYQTKIKNVTNGTLVEGGITPHQHKIEVVNGVNEYVVTVGYDVQTYKLLDNYVVDPALEQPMTDVEVVFEHTNTLLGKNYTVTPDENGIVRVELFPGVYNMKIMRDGAAIPIYVTCSDNLDLNGTHTYGWTIATDDSTQHEDNSGNVFDGIFYNSAAVQ